MIGPLGIPHPPLLNCCMLTQPCVKTPSTLCRNDWVTLDTLKSETNKTCQQDTELVTAGLLKGECWYKRIIHILLNHQKMYTSV